MARTGIVSLVFALLLTACATTSERLTAAGFVSVEIPDVPEPVVELFTQTFSGVVAARHIDTSSAGPVALHGYLSTVSSGAGTLFIYVFDFEDLSGERLLRVGGQASTVAAPADPWAAVTQSMAQSIVNDVLDGFESWLRGDMTGGV